MFESLQVASKLVIIAVVVVAAGAVSVRVWRADLDLRRLFSPKRVLESSTDKKLSWLPTRQPDTLYQDGKAMARVSGPAVDEAKAEVRFDEIYQSNDLDLGAEFDFRKWRLRFDSAESITMLDTSSPHKGKIIEKAICKIAGVRAAL